MTKTDLIKSVATATGINQATVNRVYAAINYVLVANLVDGDGRYADPHLGTLVRISRHPRKGRNIKTGEVIEIPATQTVKFRPSAKVVKRMNK